MSSLGTTFLAAAVALCLSGPALAQSKMDAGSGPTSGAVSANDAGSGPTSDATPKMGSTAAGNSNTATQNDENSAAPPGAEVDWRLATSHADNEEAVGFAFKK